MVALTELSFPQIKQEREQLAEDVKKLGVLYSNLKALRDLYDQVAKQEQLLSENVAKLGSHASSSQGACDTVVSACYMPWKFIIHVELP